MSTVQNVIDAVSQDIRKQLSSTVTPGQSILIDYTNRIHKQMLRFSRWGFILSEPQYFMTVKGQTDYWLGTANGEGAGQVDTGLNLNDVDRMMLNSVRDMSNNGQLEGLNSQPLGPSLNYRSGQSRAGLPKTFWHNHNDPFVLHIYPAPDNSNPYTPYPSSPILMTTIGGALTARTYFVRVTFVDSASGESTASDITSSRHIAANSLMTVASPSIPYAGTASGVTYSSYNVYAGTAEGGETKQNASPIAIGTNWTEPTSGLITSGASVPTSNTLAQLGGYIIQFQYYKARTVLSTVTAVLQVPDDYFDVVVQGVASLAFRLLGKKEEASAAYQAYKAGLTEMVIDKNLFPNPDFVRPDPGSYVNQQTIGILPNQF